MMGLWASKWPRRWPSLWAMVLSGLVLVPGAASAAPADAPPPIRILPTYEIIAMMPLSSLGSTDEIVEAINRVLVSEVKGLLRERLVPPEELRKRGSPAADSFMECEGHVVCLVEVMGGLGWDAFVVGNIAGLGSDRIISLKLIDIRTGSEVRHARQLASGDQEQLIVQMRQAAVTLLAPDLLVGALEVQCPQDGVQIMVDGQLIGTCPLKQNRVEVAVGPHAIEAKAEGRASFSTLVELGYGESKTITIDLADNRVFMGGSAPFYTRWWTWTAAGTGVVATGLGVLFNVLQAETADRINQRAAAGTLTVEYRDLYRQEEEQWLMAVSFYAAGGLLLGAVGALLGVDLVTF